ncbi:DUF6415 family natural product biosynthesis protein [Streptomyces sp. enrichment culture]|uniref:DUF6415 family natural product biosynthesis protein n=1 Tax=Streptomyces sp. enrichment culture TaxID=1795815 RepID=UPI003F54D3A8
MSGAPVPDTDGMRAAAQRVLRLGDAPGEDEVAVLVLALRGMFAVLVPAVEDAARTRHKRDPVRFWAEAGAREARVLLAEHPCAVPPAQHARRLARGLLTLVDDFAALS